MKLYLPTTSLNFNDIFATESISPKYFYQNRSYGTKRHFTTELSLSEYYITLFKEIPYFDLIDSSNNEYEEYPIVLELNIDSELYKLIKVNDNVYLSYRTIYLNFDNVKVLFFSESDRKIIIAKSEIVSETKTISKYKNKFIVINKNLTSSFNLSIIPTPTLGNEEELYNELKKDRIFNHIKGFYYGYIAHKTLLNYKKRCKELSINLEALQKLAELKNLYKDLNTKYVEIMLDLVNLSFKYAQEDMESSKILRDKIINGFAIFQLDRKNSIVFNKNETDITEDMIVFQTTLNCILQSPKTTKTMDVSKEIIEKIINDIGLEIKRTFGNNSIYSKDHHLIYQRVVQRDYTIEISNLNSYVFQNFLAFILKYNNIDELFTFLELKKIRNSNLAYSFLGAFIGFSGLSKTITNNLFSDDNEELLKYIDTIISGFREQIWTSELESFSSETSVNRIDNEIREALTEQNVINLCKTQQDNKGEFEIRKTLYIEIQRIKSNKILNSFLKKSKITLPGDIQVMFEKVGPDVDITFLDSKHDYVINIELKSKINLLDEEDNLFKSNLLKLGIKKSSFNGTFPMFKYSKTVDDRNQELTTEDERYLLEYLRLLK